MYVNQLSFVLIEINWYFLGNKYPFNFVFKFSLGLLESSSWHYQTDDQSGQMSFSKLFDISCYQGIAAPVFGCWLKGKSGEHSTGRTTIDGGN